MLTVRHRWCVSKIVESFSPEVSDEQVQSFIRQDEIKRKFSNLFKANGLSRLFVYYQPITSTGDNGNVSFTSKDKEPELFLCEGESEALSRKCCYFVRNVSPDQALPEDKESESGDLLFGELSGHPLSSIESLLSNVYKPMIEACGDWGKVDEEQKNDFLGEMDHFIYNLAEALKSLAGGLELTPTDPKWLDELNTLPQPLPAVVPPNNAMKSYFEGLLEKWCTEITNYKDPKQAEPIQDEGPKGELEYWRNRMQRLTSASECKNRPDCIRVKEYLQKATNKTDSNNSNISLLLKRWTQIDIQITEEQNEAKDNVKYLFTLERFIEPLYTGTPSIIVDTLPALMNSIKMIHTIARYYNTREKMTNLFQKITDQMIKNCRNCITGGESPDSLWDEKPQQLVRQLESCLKLNDAYQEQYKTTKKKLQQMPKGKQFDFTPEQIFGKFDLFCRRIIKLIDMFSTIEQFNSLSQNKLEGMEELIEKFEKIKKDFRLKRLDLLDYHNNKFDHSYCEFNVNISDLEGELQLFINQSFENISSIEHSLNLLRKFQSILQRESLKSDLDSKLNIIFQNYGMELEQVQKLYESQKLSPPIPRNLPPVAGNITWARHLFKRIVEPMKQFERNQNVLSPKDASAKRIIRMYNKLARTLVAFEYLWFQAWEQSIEQAKAGLQATLIIRHPDDKKLYVNFDQEIVQLIREAKCLDRMGIPIPEAAKIALFQEEKFKFYYNELHWALMEYDRVITRVIPVTAVVLRPHFKDMEHKLRPGMTTLTWTSMNIESYISNVKNGLQKLEELVTNVNDIIENRIEKALKVVSKTLLVDLPEGMSFTVEDFVKIQEKHIIQQSTSLQGKNMEIEYAVDDLIKVIRAFELDQHHVEAVSDEEIFKLKKHYNHFMYQALLHCAKNSMNTMKKRIASRSGSVTQLFIKPFFEVSVHISPPKVLLQPSLDDIQDCINKSAQAVLRCFLKVDDWGGNPEDMVPGAKRPSFFERVTKDIEIVRVALLLTGCIQGIRNTVADFLNSFNKYDWLWKEDKDKAYDAFVKSDPSLDDYRMKLNYFGNVENEIADISDIHCIGALSLKTSDLKSSFQGECAQWKVRYSDRLHNRAKDELEKISEYIRVTHGRLCRDVYDLESLDYMMTLLREVRTKESGINNEIGPIMSMYQMLEFFLPPGFMNKEEIDKKVVLLTNWKKLVKQSEIKTSELATRQAKFKRTLIRDVRVFQEDVKGFRKDFLNNGPMVQGIEPMVAVERLNRFKEEYKIRDRKFKLYSVGEEIFQLEKSHYPDLVQTEKEMRLSDQLYGLYTDVLENLDAWGNFSWEEVVENMSDMSEKIENFALRCKKLPGRLREWQAYKELRDKVEDYQVLIPLLEELTKPSIQLRHWEEVVMICTPDKPNGEKEEPKLIVEEGFPGSLPLADLLAIGMTTFKEDIEEVTDGADKQMKIRREMDEIAELWTNREFGFMEWKGRGIQILKGTVGVMEELEESQMKLQQMLTQRHVAPFKAEAQEMLAELSDASETLERWVKVQMMWCSLESVFTGGDIAKQMPAEAKKFSKIDKDWQKCMANAYATLNAVEACKNEVLKASLPVMYSELEKCQKSLEGYLEQKRNKFPRFFFVSNPGLLIILSQGSDPLSMNDHYEKVFDAIEYVDHNRKDKTIIEVMNGDGQRIPFSTPVKAVGNIEDWLVELLKKQQITMKDLCRVSAGDVAAIGGDTKTTVDGLRNFVDSTIAQFALLGIQMLWTNDIQTALENAKVKKTIMQQTNQKQLAVLTEMSSWCLQDLGAKTNRTKIETLVTIHVHQRDVMNDLFKLKVKDPNDFEWLKQARFFWRPNMKDECNADGSCVTSITDVDFSYQYEYLGTKERLVITPLTDRCYITLAQALGMYFGGAPAGPAGTGKTETVKDLGRTLGIFVVVTNCTDQQKYTDCAKIFKGLCQSGLWGCFDEFNRILLPVLSVVAQQVLAIQNAKKAGAEYFQFPGDDQDVKLLPACGFFITMNPGYAGRQELPENLKALFRGVAMMVPDFQIIKKVKLCSVGYIEYEPLSVKFFVLYNTCKEQLSAQKHYDWGLRNILAVLRTAGQTKRDNIEKSEAFLVYRTLRDMNLSKLVAQDVPLFLSLLADLFPAIPPPPKGEYPEVEACLKKQIIQHQLVQHDGWVSKVIQFYETTRVRHGIMLVGSAGSGKTKIFDCLSGSLTENTGRQHRMQRFNPKALRAPEMYGEVDLLSGEWTTGVFAAMWAKFNNKNNPYNMWIIADGPVDAIWIEDLNTVLDDNRLLTLANGDRIPMTDNVKIMFEVETLINASPATVSRAGIIYVSDTDLDWAPVYEAWVRKRPEKEQEVLRQMKEKWLGENTPTNVGICFDFLNRNCSYVLPPQRVAMVLSLCNLFAGLTNVEADGVDLEVCGSENFASMVEKIFLYSLVWTVGGLLEQEDRLRLFDWLREKDTGKLLPQCNQEETVYEYFVNKSGEWELWRPPLWSYPQGDNLDFSNLLVPTMDSTRAMFLIKNVHKQKKSVLAVGAEGTAKTSTNLMFLKECDPEFMLIKRINFSSATTPFMCQNAIEVELDKRGGKSFGPANGKKMTFFIDDLSMPEMNKWGDQPTLEMVRLVVETGGFPFLDKDKRGDFKNCEDLQYIGAMGHPGGGKNDIPNRLKKNFYMFNLVLPSITSINDIYGQMLSGRFPAAEWDKEVLDVVNVLTKATIDLWRIMKDKMLPTPAKFHYIFNMRELSRVFQGVLFTPKQTFKTCGGLRAEEKKVKFSSGGILLAVWKHECARVFCDKLTNDKDKSTYKQFMQNTLEKYFPPELVDELQDEVFMVNFLRDDIYDEDGVMIEEAPKVYEPGGTLTQIRERVLQFLNKYNEEFPSKKMELVLFDDALRHLLRINRLLEMPRGSALLVGVGGSGKQSLTRLTSYISRSVNFQITLTKTYNLNALIEDLKFLYISAGHQRKRTTFLFTESEIKDDVFLELINSILMTGEVPGLFLKEEYMAMTADLRNAFLKDRPGMEETQDNMKQYFIDLVRDNLHLVLCMSPLNPKFPIRARKFPGLISGPTIDWFLPWPKEALVDVSKGIIQDYPIECSPEDKIKLMEHMGSVHKMVTDVCEEYFTSMRRVVYQTPKSYLSFIANFKGMYTNKLQELQIKEQQVNLGLSKLIQGAADVEAMKIVLAEEQVKLAVATEETNKMLGNLEINAAEAKKEGDVVQIIKNDCEAEAARIASDKAECEKDLAKAQPYVDEAEKAIKSIKPGDIQEIKKLPKPPDIIKLIFDGVLILFMKPLNPIKTTPTEYNINKKVIPFIESSFVPYAQQVMGDSNFLNNVVEFGVNGKDKMNEETIEFILPYMDIEDFNPDVAQKASNAARGLCNWVRMMKFYHEASKIVKPKLEALSIAQGKMDAANKALASAQSRLDACTARLNELQAMFDAQMAEKKRIEDGAMMLQKKMTQASQLINGLAGERVRWTEDSNNFADEKIRLVGDCAVACAFVSYAGPFNQQFRSYLINDKFKKDCFERGVPVSPKLDDSTVIPFLVDIGTIGDWNLQGLPQDNLSTQNGILVTRSSRFPLLIDPQGQALKWVSKREENNVPMWKCTTLGDPKLRDKLEYCMAEGFALVIVQVEEEIDPMLDPVMEKQLIQKGKKLFVNVSDKMMDYDPKFMMYFITRLPNPNFSPELQAKTTVVDFTVTQLGLEDQLLGKVIGKEQKALEDQLAQVLEEVNSNTKALMHLDAVLLQKLTSNTGSLLEDETLIGTLAETKSKAAEVNAKLIAADETKANINEKREQYRKVAERGSVLYFSIVEMSLVNCMYQTSLDQFLVIFMESMNKSEKASLASKRVVNIIEVLTYMTYRYINRGLYERDKLTFLLIVTLKILITSKFLSPADFTLFLRGGAALDINSVRRKTFGWLTNEAWLNVIELSQSNKFFGNLPNEMAANEAMWRRWYEDNEPEQIAIPDYDQRLAEQGDIGPFLKLLLVRSLRTDRCILSCKDFIRNTTQMGPRYVEPVTDTIESIYEEMLCHIPVIFLLSTGADPTDSIETLARKRKFPSPAVISLGEGQEPVAIKAMELAMANGTWVLLQNCELGIPLMVIMEDFIGKKKSENLIDPAFRLFITALPSIEFPLGLLQMSTKVTNEPPAGLKAGILRSYTVIVDQDRLERVESVMWRQLLFGLCFLHSTVQERRKFGPLGFCIPYEFNNGDLTACILFLEKHLYTGNISWPTFQYMVSEAQYGGKITDNLDRRMFQTYTQVWLTQNTCSESFTYNPAKPLLKIQGDFNYKIGTTGTDINEYRAYLNSFPEIDSPEIFGLHPNADLTFRVKEVGALFDTLGETQPKGGSSGGGASREDIVFEKCDELLERLPEDYNEDEYKAKINKLGGLAIPLNIFLYQEIQRLQKVIAKIRFVMQQLQLAIKGEVVMSEELADTLSAMYDAKVPQTWVLTVAGDEFSWILPTLGLWFSSLLLRDEQNRTWLNSGRPNSYWLTGFFNPQGMLTAMKQEVTRNHRKDNWALDDVIYHTEVSSFERVEQVRSKPDEGVYVHGLFLEGGAYDKNQGQLCESEPKKLFVPLPVLLVTANQKDAEMKVRKEMFGAQGPYEAPCYKYPKRTDRFFVFFVTLKCTPDKNPRHWTLRGAALLCNTD